MQASESAPPRTLQIEGETFGLVTGGDLENALRGKTIHDLVNRESGITSGYTETFSAEGNSYGRSGDRIPWNRGTFAIVENHYCTNIYMQECFALLKSDRGDFAKIFLRDGVWAYPHRVEIHPSQIATDLMP